MTPTLGGRPYYTYNSKTSTDGNTANDENYTTYSKAGSPIVGVPYKTTQRGAVDYTYDNYGNVATDLRNGVTTTYTFNPNNKLSSVTNGTTTETYALDGAGNRMLTTGGDLNGFKTRYSIDGRVASLDGVSGTTKRYDDFRRDPFGRPAVVGRGGLNELASNAGYQVRRDNATTISMLGVPAALGHTTAANDDITGQSPVNTTISTGKDLGYSFADGSTDTFEWGMVANMGLTAKVNTLKCV